MFYSDSCGVGQTIRRFCGELDVRFFVADFVGSSGTLIGAALETSGYYYQSYIIDFLLGSFRGLSYFIWVVGALFVLSSWAIQGRSQFTNWLLLGPLMFFAILAARTETAGSDWIYGGEPRDAAKVQQRAKEMLRTDLYVAEVPSLFAAYNRIVSGIVRSLVATINATRERMDTKMLVRAQLYGFAMSPTIQDPRLREMLHLYLLGDCRLLLKNGREMMDEHAQPDERCRAAKEYQKLSQSTRTGITSERSLDYLAGVLVDMPGLESTWVGDASDSELQRFRTDYQTRFGPSCVLAASTGTGPLPAAPPIGPITASGAARGPNTAAEVKAAADAERIQRKEEWKRELAARPLSCHDVWRIVYAGIEQSAAATVGTAVDSGIERGFTRDEVILFLKQFTGQRAGTDEALVRAISRRLFKDEAVTGNRAAFIAEYERRGTQISGIGVSGHSELDQLERSRGDARIEMQRTTFMMHALSLPYYQGLLLYFLAIAFPFFAMLLLVPGKNAGFHLWFMLWLWVKSWDVGYAAVALVDDVLFSLFATTLENFNQPDKLQLAPELSLAALSLRELDPSFNLATYYNIMAALLHTIPFIMSYIIIGSISQGASIVSAGVNRALTGRFGMGGGMATASQQSTSQFRVDQFRAAQQEEQFEGMRQAALGKGGANDGGADGKLDYNKMDQSSMTMFGMSPQEYMNYSGKLSAVNGFTSGLGFTSTFLPSVLQRGGVVTTLIDAAAAGAGPVAREARDAIMDVADAQFRTAATWEQYEIAQKSGMQNVARRMMYGQLPVMDVAQDGYIDEFKLELETYEKRYGLAASAIEGAGGAASTIFGGLAGPGSRSIFQRFANLGITAGGALAWKYFMSPTDDPPAEDKKP